MDCMFRAVGRASMSARVNTSGWATFSTSTVATMAFTSTVCPTDPGFMSASTGTVIFAGTSTCSLTEVNPSIVKVTVYVPGRTSTMEYRPSLLVVTVRDLSISASLAASTLTPAMTAPELSFATPAIVLCAEAVDENRERTTKAARTYVADFTVMLLPSIRPKGSLGEILFQAKAGVNALIALIAVIAVLRLDPLQEPITFFGNCELSSRNVFLFARSSAVG